MNLTIEEAVGNAAAKISSEINADCIVSIKKYLRENRESYQQLHYNEIEVSIFRRLEKEYKKYEYITEVSKKQVSQVVFIKRILLNALNKGYLNRSDKIVLIEDKNITPFFKGALYIFEINNLFANIGEAGSILEGLNMQVIEAIIDIALELSEEGREGKTIGTAFIISGNISLDKYLKQLILNPFEKEEKNIIDHNIRESIKEFAQLDGVFIINNNGKIISTGTYIDINSDTINLPLGLGTRHRNCAALTKETDAIAVVLSESGGIIRIFKNGAVIMKLP